MVEQAKDTSSQTGCLSQHFWILQTSSQVLGATFCIPCLVTWKFGSAGCWDSFENLKHLSLLYLSFNGATNLHPYLNDIFHQQIEVPTMPDKLENSSGCYTEALLEKVKCLMCEGSFAKKAT